jgi:hypothetical protein
MIWEGGKQEGKGRVACFYRCDTVHPSSLFVIIDRGDDAPSIRAPRGIHRAAIA